MRNVKKKFPLWIILVIVGVLVIAIAAGLFFAQKAKEERIKPIVGNWEYDEYVQYIFESNGKGHLFLDQKDIYEYTFDVNGDQVSLDFPDNAEVKMMDCVYTFKVDGNKLTLIGGEGTTGGEYQLTLVP